MTPEAPRSKSADPMRFAYADPPYPGQSKKHYGDHPDYAGEVDHAALVARLRDEYPDGWALSTKSNALRWLLPLCPERTRVLAWVKPFAVWKKGVYPCYAWEPVLLAGGRNAFGARETCKDYISAIPPVFTRKNRDNTKGQKPLEFSLWLFDCLGALPGDVLDDMFPGSGAVASAWEVFCGQQRIAFPVKSKNESMWEEDAA